MGSNKIYIESLLQNLYSVRIRVKGPGHGDNSHPFGGFFPDLFFDGGFSGAGFPHHQTQIILSGVDFQDIIYLLLIRRPVQT